MIKLNTFENLTFSQAKCMIQQGVDIHAFIEKVENQPAWLEFMGTITYFEEIAAIIQGGCSSGAFMPAVTYHTALKTMYEYDDDILEFIEHQLGEIPQPGGKFSWSGLAVHFCSLAVELWASQFDEVISILQENDLY